MKEPSENINTDMNRLISLGSELLDANHKIKMKVGGYSMFPLLRRGDEIIIKRCKAEELQIGDLVVFGKNEYWIAHRLLKKISENGKTTFISRGDACIKYDIPYGEERLIGKVISCYRKGKMIKSSYNTYKKIFLLIPDITATVFYLAAYIIRIKKKILFF